MELGARLGSGRTAEIFEWGEGRVVKLFHPGCPRDSVEHEWRTARLVGGLGLPAPAVHGLVEIAGRPGLLYDRVPGRSMLAEIVRAPWNMATYAGMLARVQADILRTRAPDLSSLRDRLAEAADDVTLPPDIRRNVRATLDTLPDGDRLCHGDLHPDNVLIVPNGRPVVIDWVNATRGHPAADAARTWLLLTITEAPGDVQRRLAGIAGRRLFAALYIRRYRVLTGVAWRDVVRWLPLVAAARLREGVAAERRALLRLARTGVH